MYWNIKRYNNTQFNRHTAFLPTGAGVQQGSDGTGVMEGVTIHGYEELYPTTVTLPPAGTFTTLGYSVQGTARI